MSNAERAKRYRERIKASPEKAQAWRSKSASRMKKMRCKSAADGQMHGYGECVYLIEADGMGAVKVGSTTNGTIERVKGLQTGCPVDLIVRATFPCPQGTAPRFERQLHDKLSDYRIRGEWFRTEAPLIQEMLKGYEKVANPKPKITTEQRAALLAAFDDPVPLHDHPWLNHAREAIPMTLIKEGRTPEEKPKTGPRRRSGESSVGW